jgi:hypothetical protein
MRGNCVRRSKLPPLHDVSSLAPSECFGRLGGTSTDVGTALAEMVDATVVSPFGPVMAAVSAMCRFD